MAKTREQRLLVAVKMCVNARGIASSLTTVTRSGYEAYDRRILRAIRAMRRWRYKPFKVDGVAVPVCTLASFVYRHGSASN